MPPPSQLDLILGLGLGPVADAADGGKIALAALDLLRGLLPWRTVVLAAGAFPRTVELLTNRLPLVVPRHDWQMRRLLRASRPEAPGPLLTATTRPSMPRARTSPPIGGPGHRGA